MSKNEQILNGCERNLQRLGFLTSWAAKVFEVLNEEVFYTCHFRSLKIYVQQGLTSNTSLRVLQYDRSCWLGTYDLKNTQSQKNAK